MKFIIKKGNEKTILQFNLIEAAQFLYFILTTDSKELAPLTEQLKKIVDSYNERHTKGEKKK